MVTPTPPQPVPVSIAFETATAETVIATDGARRIATITIDARITNEGDGPLTHTWINPSLGTGSVNDVTTSDPTATLTKVAGRWYLANLALAPGDSLILTLTLVTEVQ